MTVTLFSLSDCSMCRVTEKWLERKKIRFEKVLIDDNPELQKEFIASNLRSMPVIRAEKAGQKVMEFAGFSDTRLNQLRELVTAP